MRTVQKLILVAVAALSSGAALANGRPNFGGQVIGPFADAGGDGRYSLRQRWQEMSPEQREIVRSRLRNEWQNLPPEQRQRASQQIFQQMRDHSGPPPGQGWRRDQGYGQGYGTRPWPERNNPGR